MAGKGVWPLVEGFVRSELGADGAEEDRHMIQVEENVGLGALRWVEEAVAVAEAMAAVQSSRHGLEVCRTRVHYMEADKREDMLLGVPAMFCGHEEWFLVPIQQGFASSVVWEVAEQADVVVDEIEEAITLLPGAVAPLDNSTKTAQHRVIDRQHMALVQVPERVFLGV